MINLTKNTKQWVTLFAVAVVVIIAICFSAGYVISVSEGYLTGGVM